MQLIGILTLIGYVARHPNVPGNSRGKWCRWLTCIRSIRTTPQLKEMKPHSSCVFVGNQGKPCESWTPVTFFCHWKHFWIALKLTCPGTGKTFIGFKLLQLLLPQSRALVMTYKNHALDDFLQHCVEAGYTDQMARIGGRSNEDSQELQACNLRTGDLRALRISWL